VLSTADRPRQEPPVSEPPARDEPPGPAAADRFAEQRAELAAVPQRPLAEHADVFAAVHSRLQEALAEIDRL
jgi:hypothetical protein